MYEELAVILPLVTGAVLIAKMYFSAWAKKADSRTVHKYVMRANRLEEKLRAFEEGDLVSDEELAPDLHNLKKILGPFIPGWLKHLGVDENEIVTFIQQNPEIAKKAIDYVSKHLSKYAPDQSQGI